MGCILSAASCSKWWIEDILGQTDYEKESADIVNLGNNRLFFLPYLMGERSPHNDPNARGCFIGISAETARRDIIQAVYEGVAFALRDSLEIARAEGVDVKRTRICGGGAKSEVWRRIIANVLNLEVDVLNNEEGPALGGAILAAVASGDFVELKTEAKRIAEIKSTVSPDPETVEKYNKKYEIYRNLYPALKESFAAMR